MAKFFKRKPVEPVKKSKRTLKLIAVAVALSTVLASLGIYLAVRTINSFFDENYLHFNRVIELVLKRPIEIRERKAETQEIIRIIETIPAPNDLETSIEKKIYDLWGLENYRIAISVAMAESHMNCNALNINSNGSVDFSVFQVNSLWIKDYSLEELANCDRNVEIAHEIWDNGDRILGNNKGSWNPWVSAKNGAYLEFLK